MHPHKGRPSVICRVKMRQQHPMRIRPPRPHENRLHPRLVLEVLRKRRLHWHCVPCEPQLIVGLGLVDKFVYLCEGVGGDDVDALEAGG